MNDLSVKSNRVIKKINEIWYIFSSCAIIQILHNLGGTMNGDLIVVRNL